MNHDRRVQLLALLALVVATIVLRLWAGPLMIDDAYITFRYAHNLASGTGAIYNPGEFVLGTSTPLFMLVLGLGVRLGVLPEVGAFVLGLVGDVGTTVTWCALGAAVKRFEIGFLTGLCVAVFHPIRLAANSGMETALYGGLVTGSFTLFSLRRSGWALVGASACALTRPEGFLVPLALLTGVFWEREWRRRLALACLPIAAWGLFSAFYFGSVVPNSVVAKVAIYPAYPQFWHNAADMAGELALPLRLLPSLVLSLLDWQATPLSAAINLLAGLVFLLALLHGMWSQRRTRIAPYALWVILTWLALAVPNRYLFPWYTIPLMAPAAFFALCGGQTLIAAWPRIWASRSLRLVGFASILILCIVWLMAAASAVASVRANLARREEMYKCVGHGLASGAARGWVVASPEVGALGRTYPGPILDLTGLVSPTALAYYQDPEFSFHFPHAVPVKLVEHARPDALVLFDHLAAEVVASPWLAENYHVAWKYSDLDPYYGSLLVYVSNRVSWSPQIACSPD